MTPARTTNADLEALLRRAHALGASMRVVRGVVKVKGWAMLPPALQQALRTHREAIAALIAEVSLAEAPAPTPAVPVLKTVTGEAVTVRMYDPNHLEGMDQIGLMKRYRMRLAAMLGTLRPSNYGPID